MCLLMAGVLKKPDRNRVPVSAFGRSGHFSFPPQFAEADLRFWIGWTRLFGTYQAIMGCSGGPAV